MTTAATVLPVSLKRTVDESYAITIGWNLAEAIGDFATSDRFAGSRLVMITDDIVRETIAHRIQAELRHRGRDPLVLSFPPGEGNKTRQTKELLEDRMIEANLGRDTLVIAVGGGVVSDMAGFVAGTFTRGVPYVNCPTTLLSAADASVGGKTGVDTNAATNLIGVFHQPAAVFIDLAAWSTLPPAEVRNGMAETVKHACLADAPLFDFLVDRCVGADIESGGILADREFCQRVATRNCEIKAQFVTQDVHEADLRMVLNLGHTFGRALEAAAGYTLSHGQAVSIGLCLQARLGLRFGYVAEADVRRVQRLLKAIGLPTDLPAEISDDLLLDKMRKDKKVRGGVFRFVFQRGIGDFVRFDDGRASVSVPEDVIRDFLLTEAREPYL